jgi:tRNA U34 5-methylaminomethyl-2-thiouridine-forming methyltransferase MnmC
MFELVTLRDGLYTLRDLQTGETFHPVVGPMAEAEAIHIQPMQLETRMSPARIFTIWDVGLGAAANAVALLEKLHSFSTPFRCLLVSFDCTLEPLRFALAHATELAYPLPWQEPLSKLLTERSAQIEFPQGGSMEWQLCLEDFTHLPPASTPDGIVYDPYSPAKNPAMWSLAHFTKLRERLLLPTVLTSYSRSTAVRVTLLLAGFYVGIGGATGEKEQTTVAANDLGLLKNPLDSSWLNRVRMSTSARPLGCGDKGPISAPDLAALEKHPQFRESME